jgi:hypothetical protein
MKKRMIMIAVMALGTYLCSAQQPTDIAPTIEQQINSLTPEELQTLQTLCKKELRFVFARLKQGVVHHKKALILTPIVIAAMYNLINQPIFYEYGENGEFVRGQNNNPSKESLLRKLGQRYQINRTILKRISYFTVIIAGILAYDLAHGKDSKIVHVWNKLFSKKQITKQSQKETVATQAASVQ